MSIWFNFSGNLKEKCLVMVIMGKTFRIVVCGTKESGKTSIIEKAIYNRSGVSLNFKFTSLSSINVKICQIKLKITEIFHIFHKMAGKQRQNEIYRHKK